MRCRPFSDKEQKAGYEKCAEINKEAASVIISKGGVSEPPKTFTFDSVFDGNSTQIEVYNLTARPIVESVLNGYNGTVFAYGQTGISFLLTPQARER